MKRSNMINHHKYVSKLISKRPTPYASWLLREYESIPVPPKPKCKIINKFLEDVSENGQPNSYQTKRKQMLHEIDKELIEKLDENLL